MTYWRYTTLFLFTDLLNSLILVCGKSILCHLMGDKLPSLPVSSLNLHISVFCCFFFSFAIFTNLMPWKLKTFDLNTSNSCIASSVSLVIPGGLSDVASAHFLKMVDLPIAWASHAICWVPLQMMHILIVFTVYTSSSSASSCYVRYIVLLFMIFDGVYFFITFMASVSTFSALCALTLLDQANTCSLVIWLVLLTVVSSLLFLSSYCYC